MKASELGQRRDLAVGYFGNGDFVGSCQRFIHRLSEVFYSWPGILSCRPDPVLDDAYKSRLLESLRWCRSNGMKLDTLFNCNCYGERSVSAGLRDQVLGVLDEMGNLGLFPDVVTTTSPFIAAMIRRTFPKIELRGSVNLRVHGTTGFQYLLEDFDSFYLSREHHRDFEYLQACAEWARSRGKVVCMQVNSGCLRECPYQQFHDNMHGHDRRRQSQEGKALDFEVFLCKKHYVKGNLVDFIKATWIRPEDLRFYRPYVSTFKLATRNVTCPEKILEAYAKESYSGNLLELMDPNIAPLFPNLILENSLFPENWATSGIGAACGQNCVNCGKCQAILDKVTVSQY
ncbi:MAG: hypothetical protein GX561_03335 [Lentisphaerae bacterium]|jgi:hypothetical protein|nr:hypothetical protein [Lentisphaerota bacterium]